MRVEMNASIHRNFKLLSCAASHWMSDDAPTTGAALAFYCAFSLAPLLVILLTIAGWVVGTKAAYGQVGAQLDALFGPATAKIVVDAVRSSQRVDGLVSTVVSIVTLLIGASTVLTALESALARIWKAESVLPGGWRGWIRTRLLSFAYILALGFLLLVSLTVSTGISNLRAYVMESHAAAVSVFGVVDFLASLAIVTAVFALIYRYMPARRTSWRVAVAGGALTAVLFDIGRWGVGFYLAHSTQPSAYGAAASFVALLLWLYYTAQIFLFGAEFTACLAGARDVEAPGNAGAEVAAPRR
jgi:membrane protein